VIVELSSKVEYALLALLELASHKKKGEPMKVSEIAASQGIPDRYLDQILTLLRRTGVVQSQRGAKGGYLLAREPWQITLLEVVSSVEGDSSPKNSDFSEATTLEKTAVLEVWLQVKKASFAALGGYTLQDLCQQRDAYRQENPMYYI
jgi:Rrf2 family protein